MPAFTLKELKINKYGWDDAKQVKMHESSFGITDIFNYKMKINHNTENLWSAMNEAKRRKAY